VPTTAAPTAAFGGFPREALDFLRELEADNDRDWFKANRARYDEHLVAPARPLAEELAAFGRPHLFRPWNDTRFHPGPPIKEHLGMTLGYEGGGGYYVELSLDGLLVAAGLYTPARDQLDRIRQGIDRPGTAATLARAIARARRDGLELGGPEMKRGPRGYPPDHPRMDLLRRRRLVVAGRHDLGAWLHRPEAAGRIRAQLAAATPLVRWLRRHVGPTQMAVDRPGGRPR
jgi:uncharacterized protein (TIGR02453 family)